VARSVHEQSPRASGPFVAVNCAAIPSTLFESELFGHEQGAFTDAARPRKGLMEQAHGGTLFLDEIGDLSIENQARILRAIEQGTFRRLGAQQETHVDIRVVAATNEDLPSAIEAGAFRLDLFHRLNGFQITVPPLRERPADIPLLAEHFLRLGLAQAKLPIKGFAPDAIEYLQSRMWPGNVRELRNCIERAIARAESDVIGTKDLYSSGAAARSEPPDSDSLTLAQMERNHIARILRDHGGNVSAAARTLRIHRNTLYNKIAQYGLEV
jgi:DNA-binding NtrC family response regulator